MYYLVTVAYETDVIDSKGNTNVKIKKIKHLVEALSVEEVTIRVAEYLSAGPGGTEVLSIVQTPIESVIDKANTPKYYK